MINSRVTLGIFLTVFFIASCSSIKKSSETVNNEGVRGVSISSGDISSSAERSTSEQALLANATVYFEYDSYRLSSKSLQALKSLADLLGENQRLSITLAGHADERGTREYNLALGQRRAEAVADYLKTLGISANRLTVRSFGEERPAALGSNESSWAKNRRVEIK
ncbi:MAG: peptidoglycan-associated lipoprotein Pal [Gammaproteobacteria bacterium]